MSSTMQNSDAGIPWAPEIPVGWQSVRLKNVCILNYGDSLADERRIDGEVPVYGSNGIVGRHNTAITTEPCLIVGRKGSYGKVNYSTEPCFPIDTTFWTDKHTCKVDLRWLSYVLPQLELDKNSQDSAVPGLSREAAYDKKLPKPPDLVQRRIAAYLDEQTVKIDRLIELRRRQMELIKEQRAALIQQAVTRGLNPDAPMKDSGFPWLGEIPAHWSITTLGRLATLLQTGPFGSQLHAHEYIEDGIPIINPSHMSEGLINHDPKCTVDVETARRLERHLLQFGDIVFARRGEIGRCVLVRADEVGWLCGTGSLLMRPDKSALEPAFLVTLFQLKNLKDSLTLQSVGSTMDNLNTGILARTRLPLPPRDEQTDILQFIQNNSAKTEDLILAYTRQLTLLAEYRAALIHECVTGRREVPE